MVGQLCVELELAAAQRRVEHLVEVGVELLRAAVQTDEVGNAVLHIPTVNPSVVLAVEVACAHTAVEDIVEGLDELARRVLRVEETRLGVENVAVV